MKKRISWGYGFRGTCSIEPIDFGPYDLEEAETKFFSGSRISDTIYELEKYAKAKDYKDFCPIQIEGKYKITGVQVEIILESHKIHGAEIKRMMDLLGWDYNSSEEPNFFFALDEAIKTYSYKESVAED